VFVRPGVIAVWTPGRPDQSRRGLASLRLLVGCWWLRLWLIAFTPATRRCPGQHPIVRVFANKVKGGAAPRGTGRSTGHRDDKSIYLIFIIYSQTEQTDLRPNVVPRAHPGSPRRRFSGRRKAQTPGWYGSLRTERRYRP